MARLFLLLGLAVAALAAAVESVVESVQAQQRSWVLRDLAMGGARYYIRGPEFIDFIEASKAAFLKDDDRVLGVAGEGVAKAYPASAVTYHHGIEDTIGELPIFVTW